MLFFVSYLGSGYTGVMPLLLLLYFLWPAKRVLLKDFIGTCNGLLLILIGMNLSYWVYELFIAWYGQTGYQRWAVPDGSFGLAYIVTHLLLQCISVILLLFKSGRRMIVVSLLAWLFSCSFITAFISEKLTPLLFGDYLPSSWSVEPKSFYQQWIGWLLPASAFAATALVFYWLQRSCRKHRPAIATQPIANPPEKKKL